MNIRIFLLNITAAIFFLAGFNIVVYGQNNSPDNYKILTPRPGPQPRLNNPLVYGARPGHPFIFRIPCQGNRPIHFTIKNLPPTLKLDEITGIITGTVPVKGDYDMVIVAKNKNGKDRKDFKLIAGDILSLTPSMGWNDWYAYYNRISDEDVRKAADVLISSGMADVGYAYINIDDCWENRKKRTRGYDNADSGRKGEERDTQGNIIPNMYFPNMKKLTDYIHTKGLKAGIYSSPGTSTCGGYVGSYQHEAQDAKQYAAWGFDFLKYDWCSYGQIAGKNPDLTAYKKPYLLMGDLLKQQDRDILLNLCQYGMGNVWEWGAEVGGQSWRTSGDLGFQLDKIFDVAINNAKHREYSKPGSWNDPDYIQIGYIGNARKEGLAEQTKMPPNMQYAYMSLWCLIASPLFYSGDMEHLDDFTLNILCNAEVIAVDQDPLGACGKVIMRNDSTFLMVKPMADGSKALGLFNRSKKTVETAATWDELQISGKQKLRDLWRQKNIGTFNHSFKTIVPAQGVVLVSVSKK
ncbi:MAG TPA: glycoside hydrolase family 27 protein [Mucilaginibacter sp.]|nr:glycoside hydrolase family 27 protein [Mucilaginibacter sp.]